jgi:hypothetical protein
MFLDQDDRSETVVVRVHESDEHSQLRYTRQRFEKFA